MSALVWVIRSGHFAWTCFLQTSDGKPEIQVLLYRTSLLTRWWDILEAFSDLKDEHFGISFATVCFCILLLANEENTPVPGEESWPLQACFHHNGSFPSDVGTLQYYTFLSAFKEHVLCMAVPVVTTWTKASDHENHRHHPLLHQPLLYMLLTRHLGNTSAAFAACVVTRYRYPLRSLPKAPQEEYYLSP